MGSINKEVFIPIGDHRIPVVSQKHARLRRKLSADDFAAIFSEDYGPESYRVLSILIPALPQAVPLYEWEGYHSQEDYDHSKANPDDDRWEEDNDPSPTTAEIINAFEEALMVSGAGRLGKIFDLAQGLNEQMGGNLQLETEMRNLPGSPGENGESPSTSIGQPTPTTTSPEG